MFLCAKEKTILFMYVDFLWKNKQKRESIHFYSVDIHQNRESGNTLTHFFLPQTKLGTVNCTYS